MVIDTLIEWNMTARTKLVKGKSSQTKVESNHVSLFEN